MQRTVLITGAGGFLARHLGPVFQNANWRSIGVGRSRTLLAARGFDSVEFDDLSQVNAVTSLLERYRPTVIVHLAAPSSVPQSIAAPLTDLAGHVFPTATLLEGVRRSGLDPRVLVISSAAVYGNPEHVPVAESARLVPISPYGFHKVQQEHVVEEYTTLYGVRCCKIRIFSTYGEGLRRLAVWEITRRALSGDLTVHGTGEEVRDFLYASAIAEAILTVAEHAECRGEAINIASGHAVTIRDLVQEIYRRAGISSSPQFDGVALAGNPVHWCADVTALRDIGYRPPSWSSGLTATVEWILRAS